MASNSRNIQPHNVIPDFFERQQIVAVDEMVNGDTQLSLDISRLIEATQRTSYILGRICTTGSRAREHQELYYSHALDEGSSALFVAKGERILQSDSTPGHWLRDHIGAANRTVSRSLPTDLRWNIPIGDDVPAETNMYVALASASRHIKQARIVSDAVSKEWLEGDRENIVAWMTSSDCRPNQSHYDAVVIYLLSQSILAGLQDLLEPKIERTQFEQLVAKGDAGTSVNYFAFAHNLLKAAGVDPANLPALIQDLSHQNLLPPEITRRLAKVGKGVLDAVEGRVKHQAETASFAAKYFRPLDLAPISRKDYVDAEIDLLTQQTLAIQRSEIQLRRAEKRGGWLPDGMSFLKEVPEKPFSANFNPLDPASLLEFFEEKTRLTQEQLENLRDQIINGFRYVMNPQKQGEIIAEVKKLVDDPQGRLRISLRGPFNNYRVLFKKDRDTLTITEIVKRTTKTFGSQRMKG